MHNASPREICEQLSDTAEDLEQIRMAQNRWRDTNPVEAKVFFRELLAQHPDNPRHLYLYARVTDDPLEMVLSTRKALEGDPTLIEAIRLMMYAYSWALFHRGTSPEIRSTLEKELETDAPVFETSLDTTPFGGSLLGMVFEYFLFTQNEDSARKTLKLAKKLGQDWAVDPRAPMILHAANGELEAVERYVEGIVKKKVSKGLLSEGDTGAEIAGELIRFFKKGLNYKAALIVAETWLKVCPPEFRAVSFIQLARCRMLLDDEPGAVEALNLALEVGWADPQGLSDYPCFYRLQGRTEWPRFLDKAAANREAVQKKKCREALDKRVDLVPEPFTLSGRGRFSISWEGMQGKITLLDFWSINCRPCRRTLPELDQFARSLDDPRVQIFPVNCRDQNRSQALHFLSLLGLQLQPLFGDLMMEKMLGVTGVPTILLLDHRGHIRYKSRGGHPNVRELIRWWIDDLVEEMEK